MLQWAASLHQAQPSKETNKQAADLLLAQGWIDVPRGEDDDEVTDAVTDGARPCVPGPVLPSPPPVTPPPPSPVQPHRGLPFSSLLSCMARVRAWGQVWVRHWFVLKNTQLMLFSEAAKQASDLTKPVVVLETKHMKSAQRAQGVDFYKWGVILETHNGSSVRMRAPGQSDMRHLLSTLNVHCIEGEKEVAKAPEVVRSKAVIRSGYMYKKSLKQTVGVRVGKAWQRRWFVLEVETNSGDPGTVVRTAKLTYFQSNKDTKDGVELPLHETVAVKGGTGKVTTPQHTTRRAPSVAAPSHRLSPSRRSQHTRC